MSALGHLGSVGEQGKDNVEFDGSQRPTTGRANVHVVGKSVEHVSRQKSWSPFLDTAREPLPEAVLLQMGRSSAVFFFATVALYVVFVVSLVLTSSITLNKSARYSSIVNIQTPLSRREKPMQPPAYRSEKKERGFQRFFVEIVSVSPASP